MKFSVLIPAYKAKFFKECLDSVLAQTYSDYEVIVLNDHSPEPIKDIVLSYDTDKIRYFENEKNVGPVDVVNNWNKLLNLAKGEYIICMGDDDKLSINCLHEYNNLISEFPNLDIYHTRTIIIDEDSNIIDIQENRPVYETVYSMIWHIFFRHRCQFIGDFLFHRQTLQNKGGFYFLPLALASDIISSEMIAAEKGIANTQTFNFYYRSSKETITSNSNHKLLCEAAADYKRWTYDFLQKTPVSAEDRIYRDVSLQNLDYIFRKQYEDKIASDLASSNFLSLFYWLKKRKLYQIPFSSLMFSCLLGFFRLMKRLNNK